MGTYNYEIINFLVDKVEEIPVGQRKDNYVEAVESTFNLRRDRSIYYCADFAVRFCTSKNHSFSNTVLSLSALERYDDRPFVVILTTPDQTYMYLANSTFLKKISHSSKELSVDNVKGSFNGSDILKIYNGIDNEPANFEQLFACHQAFSWEENLERLVEATNNIVPQKRRFELNFDRQRQILFEAPSRSLSFIQSQEFKTLEQDLVDRTKRAKNEIAIAASIDNVNLRGRIIEELITADSPEEISSLTNALLGKTRLSINTDQKLGDYSALINGYVVETDIKSKVLSHQSAPKAFNVDKFLEFLSTENTIYLFYLIGIDNNKEIAMKLVSVFDHLLLENIVIQHHWAGRDTRGVAQFNGNALDAILKAQSYEQVIDQRESTIFLEMLLDR